jgi:hypothetical protein
VRRDPEHDRAGEERQSKRHGASGAAVETLSRHDRAHDVAGREDRDLRPQQARGSERSRVQARARSTEWIPTTAERIAEEFRQQLDAREETVPVQSDRNELGNGEGPRSRAFSVCGKPGGLHVHLDVSLDRPGPEAR